jgi:type I restriction enzyme M protein
MGQMMDRVPRELTKEEIQNIARTNHAWQGEHNEGQHRVPRLLQEPNARGGAQARPGPYPRRYVGAEVRDNDDEPFEEKMAQLGKQLQKQQAEAAELVAAIEAMLRMPGFSMQR